MLVFYLKLKMRINILRNGHVWRYHTLGKFREVTLAVKVQLAYVLIGHMVLVQVLEHLIRTTCSALIRVQKWPTYFLTVYQLSTNCHS